MTFKNRAGTTRTQDSAKGDATPNADISPHHAHSHTRRLRVCVTVFVCVRYFCSPVVGVLLLLCTTTLLDFRFIPCQCRMRHRSYIIVRDSLFERLGAKDRKKISAKKRIHVAPNPNPKDQITIKERGNRDTKRSQWHWQRSRTCPRAWASWVGSVSASAAPLWSEDLYTPTPIPLSPTLTLYPSPLPPSSRPPRCPGGRRRKEDGDRYPRSPQAPCQGARAG